MARGYDIFLRRAPVVEVRSWEAVTTVRTAELVRDELAWWGGPALQHGDVVRVLNQKGREHALCVWDATTSSLVSPPRPAAGSPGWVVLWDESQNAQWMLRACERVSPRKLASAARAAAAFVQHDAGDHVATVRSTLAACEALEAGAGSLDRTMNLTMHLIRAGRNVMADTADTRLRGAVLGSIGATVSATICTLSSTGETGGADALRAEQSPTTGADRAVDDAVRSVIHAGTSSWYRGSELEVFYQDSLSAFVRTDIPLSVMLCAREGLPDPLPPRTVAGRRNGAR